MRKTFPFYLAGFMAISGMAFAQLSLPVTDTFPSAGTDLSWVDYDDAAYDNVESFSPTAPSGDGYALNVNDGSGWQFIKLADDDGTLSDVKITAMIYVGSNTTAWSRFGVVVRAQDGTIRNPYNPAGYYFIVDSDGDNYMRVVKYISGDWVELLTDEDSPDHTRDAWHEFSLQVEGDTVTAWWDGTEVYSGTDTEYTEGEIGIINFQSDTGGDATMVDRVTIEAVEPADVDDWAVY